LEKSGKNGSRRGGRERGESLRERGLGRCGEPLDGLDPDDGRDDRDLEAAVGFAEVFLHGLAIEPAGDLLGGGDREIIAGDLDQAALLELIFQQFAFRFGALEDGVGLAEQVRKRLIGDVVEAGGGCGRGVVSLGHGFTPLAWVRAERVFHHLLGLLFYDIVKS